MKSYGRTREIGHSFRQGDSLLIRFFNSVTAASYLVQARFLNPDGSESIFKRVFFPAATGAAVDFYEPTAESFLVSLRISVATQTVVRGRTWVEAIHMQGLDSGGFPLNTLLNGYVTTGSALSFPSTPLSEPLQGAGALTLLYDDTAVADTEKTVSFPTLYRLARLAYVTCDFDIDQSVAGTRQLVLKIEPNTGMGANTHIFAFPTSQYTESVPHVYCYWGNYPARDVFALPASPTSIVELMPLPPNITLEHNAIGTGVLTFSSEGFGTLGDRAGKINVAYEGWVAP